MNKRFLRIIKIIILLIPILIFAWILNKQFAPFGKATFKYNFKKDSAVISDLYPRARTSDIEKEKGEYYKTLTNDSVYFDLNLPRWFSTAIFEIKFKNQNPIFEIGGRKDKEKWIFDKRPLENKIIDNLARKSSWHKLQEGNLILLQKEKKFESVSDFFENLPASEKIATYFYDKFARDIKFPKYEKSNKTLEINQALRGYHTIYTYIKNEDLHFIFSVVDINRQLGPDRLNFNVYQYSTGKKIYTKTVKDDGEIEPSGKISKREEVEINIPGLEEGIYKIELDFSDDLIIRKIKTNQSKIVFGGRLFIAKSDEYFKEIKPEEMATDFYSSGKRLVISTAHPRSLQTIKINNSSFDISKINQKYILGKDEIVSEGLSLIHSPKNDLFIESNGYFAFSLDSFFYPQPKNIIKLNAETEPEELKNLNFIVASYTTPKEVKNEWKVARAEFDLTKLYMDKDFKIQFMLSAPGLYEEGRETKIGEIKVTLKKPPLTPKNFISRLKSFVRRAKKG